MELNHVLVFELGSQCNLGRYHKKCPNMHPERYVLVDTSRELDDDTIVECAVSAYQKHGFTGLIAWHFYNEPTLQSERMFALMDRIREQIPQSRFLLWTNGTRFPVDPTRIKMFSLVYITDYFGLKPAWEPFLGALGVVGNIIGDPVLDDRLQPEMSQPQLHGCIRVFTEFIIDNYGNHHPCCFDWRGVLSLGNVYKEGFDELVRRSKEFYKLIVKQDGKVPEMCQWCQKKQFLMNFDDPTGKRIERWLYELFHP